MREKLAGGGKEGEVTLCGACEDAHLRWGKLSLSLPREEFLRLADMVVKAAEELQRRPESSLPRMESSLPLQ